MRESQSQAQEYFHAAMSKVPFAGGLMSVDLGHARHIEAAPRLGQCHRAQSLPCKSRAFIIWVSIDIWPDDQAVSPSLLPGARADPLQTSTTEASR